MKNISIEEAAAELGVTRTYLKNALAKTDPPDRLRKRICIRYPETRLFMVPDWARQSDTGGLVPS
jgi:hypothetical protein